MLTHFHEHQVHRIQIQNLHAMQWMHFIHLHFFAGVATPFSFIASYICSKVTEGLGVLEPRVITCPVSWAGEAPHQANDTH